MEATAAPRPRVASSGGLTPWEMARTSSKACCTSSESLRERLGLRWQGVTLHQGQAQVESEGEQLLLDAVVKVALQGVPLGDRPLHDVLPSPSHVSDPRGQLRCELLVDQHQARRAIQRLLEVWQLRGRVVVDPGDNHTSNQQVGGHLAVAGRPGT